MGFKSITQIVLFITAIVVIFTYIQPTFVSIKKTEDELAAYTNASNKAGEFNAKLAELRSAATRFSNSDVEALKVYLPAEIDAVQVMADITTMADLSGVSITSMTAGEVTDPSNDVLFGGERVASDGTAQQDFELALSGNYEAFKSLLKLFEQNKYPLEIISLTFGSFVANEKDVVTNADTLEGQYALSLRTYAYTNTSN